jgi:arginase
MDDKGPAEVFPARHLAGDLSTRQVIDLIHRVGRPVVGADVVEFNPRMDTGGITAVVCAKVAKEIAGVMSRRA